MKKQIINVFIITLLSIVLVFSKSYSQDLFLIQKEEYCDSYYEDSYEIYLSYFSTEPNLRTEFFHKLLYEKNKNPNAEYNEYIPYFLAISFFHDLSTLSNKEITYHNYHIGSDVDFILLDKKKFEKHLALFQNNLIAEKYLKGTNKLFLELELVSNSYLDAVYHYTQNTPQNRILFLDKYKNELPVGILKLFKIDLDNLFEVKTPNFFRKKSIKKKKLLIAKRMWSTRLK